MSAALAPPAMVAPHHNLRAIMRGRGFRRLLAARLLSQVGDGWFQAGLASSVFFNPERAASPVAITSAFAVLLLPYSMLGPFVGVFLDRWSRRNTLFVANLSRAVLVLPAAGSVWRGREDAIFVVAALGVVALNRFFLSGISASQPHVVDAQRLVTANSFASTAGTVVYTASLASAGVAFHITDTGLHAYATLAMAAAAWYGLAAAVTLGSFRAGTLGPDDAERPATSVLGGLLDTARGMVSGLRHLVHRPVASSVLLMQAGHRALYGVLTITTLLLYRNYYTTENAVGAIVGLLPVAAAAATGSLLAALITPRLTRRIGGRHWLIVVTAAAAVLVPALGLPYIALLTVGGAFVVSVAAQATKIVTDTALQLEIEDDFRGRVFSVNDTAFNLMFVTGVLIGALTTPETGHSPAMMVAIGLGYGALALWFAMVRPRSAQAVPTPLDLPNDGLGQPNDGLGRPGSHDRPGDGVAR